ncbi:MAG: SIMPL domain-containing protein [Bacteroidetes bacterium MedPE-SWsnd-G2]|nr:MAG: SIMPL domain-containing protein [Bacteroidetes bacterium MedPE-SWsnd-G2]
MKLKRIAFVAITLCAYQFYAQHKGNYNQIEQTISRQNIAMKGNAQIYNPITAPNPFQNLSPSEHITIDVRAMHNVEATNYTAVFNLSQIGVTAEEANTLINERINGVKQNLSALGIKEESIAADVISFVPVYDLEIEKKIFNTKYVEVPKGFELQQNLHIAFTKTNQFESILSACASNSIYNLVKVDYFIPNIAEIYKGLQTELLDLIQDKKEYYKLLGFDVNEYKATVADDKFCYFPKDFYQSYQAYNSVSFEAIKKRKGVTQAKKQTSYYYQPLTFDSFDIVKNPSILEPVIQIGMQIKLNYSPLPKEKPAELPKPETKHKYYIISPNGTIDVKELITT